MRLRWERAERGHSDKVKQRGGWPQDRVGLEQMVGARNPAHDSGNTSFPGENSTQGFPPEVLGWVGAHGEELGRTKYQGSIVGVEGKERVTPSCLSSTLSSSPTANLSLRTPVSWSKFQ